MEENPILKFIQSIYVCIGTLILRVGIIGILPFLLAGDIDSLTTPVLDNGDDYSLVMHNNITSHYTFKIISNEK